MHRSSRDSASVWLTDQPMTRAAGRVSAAETVDVVVVGAGLAGMCTALRLHEDGLRILIVDAGRVGGRTTGHSTAKITALHGAVYASLLHGKGAEGAALYAAANQTAVDDFSAVVERLAIECHHEVADAFTVAAGPDGVARIEAEAAAATEAGLPVELTTSTDLPFEIAAAIRLRGQAHFDPVAFTNALASHLTAGGVTIVEDTRVESIEERDERCTVRMGSQTVSASFVVQTTHLPIVDPGLLAARIRPMRSYVVAGPVSGAGRDVAGMYLAADEGWSVRPWAGASEPWLLVGGEGHPMTKEVTSSGHYQRLAEWAQQRLGVRLEVRWSAFDYTTPDGVPYIGRLAPCSRRRFVATGFGKWGMTTSMVAARIIADHIAERANPYAALFDATRLAAVLGRDLVRDGSQVAGRFIGDRVRTVHTSGVDDLAPGQGRIQRQGFGTPVAVAMSLDGTLHRVRATCTHLGCLIQFNDGDQVWDCPCHGSRFALDGTVLDGPATQNLRPVSDDR